MSDPGDFATMLAGLAKLQNRRYHAEPLSKALGNGLFELRHVGKLNSRLLWFFMKGRRIIVVHAIATRPMRSLPVTYGQHGNEWLTGTRE